MQLRPVYTYSALGTKLKKLFSTERVNEKALLNTRHTWTKPVKHIGTSLLFSVWLYTLREIVHARLTTCLLCFLIAFLFTD